MDVLEPLGVRGQCGLLAETAAHIGDQQVRNRGTLGGGEILTAVSVSTYGKGTGGAYFKHRHPASSYAVVGVAALVTVAGGKVSKVSLAVSGGPLMEVKNEYTLSP